jgi:hypothetical protein
MSTTLPQTVHFGKINPLTGVVTHISQQPLAYSTFTINGSSTIDPSTGIYYYLSVLPQGGNAVIGVSTLTGSVVSVDSIPTNGGSQVYFDLIRHPSDCYGAQAYRLDSSGGTADITSIEQHQSKVFPNPFSEKLTISSADLIDAYILRDIQGKIIGQDSPQKTEFTIQTTDLENGIYLIELKSSTNSQLVKLIKE